MATHCLPPGGRRGLRHRPAGGRCGRSLGRHPLLGPGYLGSWGGLGRQPHSTSWVVSLTEGGPQPQLHRRVSTPRSAARPVSPAPSPTQTAHHTHPPTVMRSGMWILLPPNQDPTCALHWRAEVLTTGCAAREGLQRPLHSAVSSPAVCHASLQSPLPPLKDKIVLGHAGRLHWPRLGGQASRRKGQASEGVDASGSGCTTFSWRAGRTAGTTGSQMSKVPSILVVKKTAAWPGPGAISEIGHVYL